MDNQEESFIAPGFDANLHDCSFCNDTGISQEAAGYCAACRMGKRIEHLDQFAEQLKGHGFTEAMRIVFRHTQRTEKAIAAADKALMMAQIGKPQWQPIVTAPRDGTHIILTNGTDVAEGWWEHEDPFIHEIRDEDGRYVGQTESDGFDDWLDTLGGMPEPKFWMPMPALPPSPVSKQG